MKEGRNKRRGENSLNKLHYALITIILVVAVAVGVYAASIPNTPTKFGHSIDEINFNGGFNVSPGHILLSDSSKLCLGTACLTKDIFEEITITGCPEGFTSRGIKNYGANFDEDNYSISGGFGGNSNIMTRIVGAYETINYNIAGYSNVIQQTLFSYGCGDTRCYRNTSNPDSKQDTCDGDYVSAYVCKTGETKTCVDVFIPKGFNEFGSCMGGCYGRLVTCKEAKELSPFCVKN